MDINSPQMFERKRLATENIKLIGLTMTNYIKNVCGIRNENAEITNEMKECVNTTSKNFASYLNEFNSNTKGIYFHKYKNEYIDTFEGVFIEAAQTDEEDEDDEDDDEDEDDD